MKIYVTRHGETTYNSQYKVCGLFDADLTEKGIEQAVNLSKILSSNKEEFNIKTIYVSNLSRARKTAEPIENALNIKAIVESGLREFDFGEKDGCPVNDEEFYKMRREPFFKFPGGESTISAAHRIYSILDNIISTHKDGNVLLVCHGTVTRLIKTYFDDLYEKDFYAFSMENCGLLCFDC